MSCNLKSEVEFTEYSVLEWLEGLHAERLEKQFLRRSVIILDIERSFGSIKEHSTGQNNYVTRRVLRRDYFALRLHTLRPGEGAGTRTDPNWFDKMNNVSRGGSFLTGSFLIKDLDIAYKIGRSSNRCPRSICLWPSSTDGFVYVPYSISSDFGSYDSVVIKAALSDIEDVTCIRFKPQTSETDYITFVASTGCWSSIGHIGEAQYISLEKPGCIWSGIVTHEVLHALGLNHEHVRRDRDEYVKVQWDNIQSDARGNFEIADTYNKDLTAYDYGSILHYPNKAFSKDGILSTLVAVHNSSMQLGRDFSMSYLDIIKINSLYKCTKTTTSTTPTTTKTTTSTTPTTTKTTTSTTPTTTRTTTSTTPTTTRTTTSTTPITAKTTTSTTPMTTRTTTATTSTTMSTTTGVNVKLGMPVHTGCGGNLTGPEGILVSPNYPQNYPSNAYCHWNITTTDRFKITFTDFILEGDEVNCPFDRLRIYNGRDLDIMYRLRDFCGQNIPPPITSYTNTMQIVFTSDQSVEKRGFSLVYQAV
ncbi:astacin-like metalloendopeptidase [Anomaloglossus baeobatrachus]|uniref:astacin-like metalloendopeptidase n=1 Tax=Anomaloglossus baeobatrachus TaxID=238106 RepID=UPI003F4FAED8